MLLVAGLVVAAAPVRAMDAPVDPTLRLVPAVGQQAGLANDAGRGHEHALWTESSSWLHAKMPGMPEEARYPAEFFMEELRGEWGWIQAAKQRALELDSQDDPLAIGAALATGSQEATQEHMDRIIDLTSHPAGWINGFAHFAYETARERCFGALLDPPLFLAQCLLFDAMETGLAFVDGAPGEVDDRAVAWWDEHAPWLERQEVVWCLGAWMGWCSAYLGVVASTIGQPEELMPPAAGPTGAEAGEAAGSVIADAAWTVAAYYGCLHWELWMCPHTESLLLASVLVSVAASAVVAEKEAAQGALDTLLAHPP